MDSPFPGMDPYLEARWSDVHVRMIAYIGEALQPRLPADLRARSEERVWAERRCVLRSPEAIDRARAAESVLVEIEPAARLDRFVQIVDVRSGNRVVTVIEVLSPWNKGAGRLNREYRTKPVSYASAGVNLVEIDLLRSSRGRMEIGQQDLPPRRRAPYLTCVRRAACGFRKL